MRCRLGWLGGAQGRRRGEGGGFPQIARADGGGRVCDDEVGIGVLGVLKTAGQSDIARGNDAFSIAGVRVFPGEDIARDLFDDEPVEGQVLVEGLDHVVTVPAGLGHRHVGPVAGGVRIAGQIEPVAAPATPIFGRGQESIDQLPEGIGRVVCHESTNLFDRRGQSGQIERGPPQQGASVGTRARGKPVFFQLGADEVVDRVMGPGGVLVRRGRRGGSGWDGPGGRGG